MEPSFKVTRRNLLEQAKWMIFASFLPLKLNASPSPNHQSEQQPETKHQSEKPPPSSNGSITAILSDYMANAGTRPLPDEVVEKTKHHTLDTIAAMISGADLPPAKIALKFAQAHPAEKIATVVGSNIVTGAIEAALCNGMMAHSDETDDSHAPSHSHPGCSIVAAALAAGEQFHVDGTRFLRSITLGYDVGPRMTMALGGLPFQIDTHRSAHSIASNFGAGAAAACAAGFNAAQMRTVLDYSAQQASGIAAWQRDSQHIEKSLVFAGFPARNALTSILMIQLGATGVDDVLSGADNFFLANSPKADPSKLIDKLGERYEVTRTNIKKWTVGSPIQAPLDALQMIMKQHPFTPDQVKSVIVRVATSEAKTVNDRDMPDISLQHMIAVMLIDKTASFKAAHDKARMKDPEIMRERAKVQLVPDEELEKLYPKRVTIVEVTLNDGQRFTQRVDAVRGTEENPMTRDEVVEKARDLIVPFIGAANAAKLIDSILNIEKVGDIRDLRPLLQRT